MYFQSHEINQYKNTYYYSSDFVGIRFFLSVQIRSYGHKTTINLIHTMLHTTIDGDK